MRLGALADRGQALRLQRLVIGAGSPLGGGTGEDRDVATAVLVLVFDAPLAGGIAVFQQPDLGMKVVLNGVISVVLGAFEPPSLGRVYGGDEFGEGSGAICHGTTAGDRA